MRSGSVQKAILGAAVLAVVSPTWASVITFTTGADLTIGGNYSGGTPSNSNDVLFDTGFPTTAASFQLGTGVSATSLAVQSINSVNANVITIGNNSSNATASNATLTLGNPSGQNNAYPGATSTDLLYVGSGSAITFKSANLKNGQSTGTGTLSVALAQSGNFSINNTTTATVVESSITGAFGLTKTGAGTLNILGGSNAYTSLTIKNGQVGFSSTGTGILGTGTVTLGDGTNSGNTAMLTVTESATRTNAIVVASGTTGESVIRAASVNGVLTQNPIFSGSVTLGSNLTLAMQRDSRTMAFSGPISGNGALSIGSIGTAQATSGVTRLSGLNSHTGGTTVRSGVLAITNGGDGTKSSLGTGTLTIVGGKIDNTDTVNAVTISTNNAQAWNGNFGFSGTGNDLNLGSGAVTLGSAVTIDVAAKNLRVDGNISGAFALGKTGAGNLILGGTNTYSGGTSLGSGGGTVILTGNRSLGSNITVTGSHTIRGIDATDLSPTSDGTTPLTINHAPTTSGTHTLTLGSSTTGTLTFGDLNTGGSGGSRVIAAGASRATFANFIGNVGISTTGNAIFFTGSMTGTGGINVQNDFTAIKGTIPTTGSNGVISLSNNGVFGTSGTMARTLGSTANTRINWTGAGGLAGYGAASGYGGANNLNITLGGGTGNVAWGASNFLTTGTTLILGHKFANGSVDWKNGLDLAAATQTVKVNRADLATATDFDAKISGAVLNGSLTKTGTGVLVLTGSNTGYAGVTTIGDGTLEVGSANALNTNGSGGNLTFTGGELRYSAANTQDYSSRIKNSTGAIKINTNGQSVTFASVLDATNTAGLTKSGVGTLTIGAGTHAYTGDTSIAAGTLLVNGSIASSHVVVDGILGGSGTTGSVEVNSGGVIAPGNSIDTLHTGDVVLENGGKLSSEIGAGTSADLLAVNGLLDLSASSDALDLISVAGNFDGSIKTIVTYTTLSGEFATVTLNGGPLVGTPSNFTVNGYNYMVDYGDGSNDAITLTVVPEPATLSLLAMGSLGLLRRRRDRVS